MAERNDRFQGLSGQVAIVTGASSGLGAATARALAREGVRVIITARREPELCAVAKDIENSGGSCATHAGDAGETGVAERVVKLAHERYGRLDILINNAGLGNYKPVLETTDEEYDELMHSNMRSSFRFTRAAAPAMVAQRSGVVVFVSSVAGLAGAANEAVYSASKFAQVGFGQSVDEELRPYGIKVCVFCPGGMKTEFAVGRGRTATGVADSTMMDPADAAESIVFACMQPRNVRLPQMVLRHMGKPK